VNTFESLPEVDQLAVQRDADLLDALASRAAEGPGDGLQGLLWVLGADVDEGLAELLAEPLEDDRSEPAAVIDLAAAGRRRAARTLTVALLAAGLVSVSGVAAAVTGDPLSPYRSVISAVTGEDDKPTGTRDDGVSRQVRVVRGALRDGDLGAAELALQDLRADVAALPRGARRGATQQLAALEAKLVRAVKKAAAKDAKATSQEVAKDENATRPGGPQSGRPDNAAVPPGQTESRTEPNGKARGQQPEPSEPADQPAKKRGTGSPGAKSQGAKSAGAPTAQPAPGQSVVEPSAADPDSSGGEAAAGKNEDRNESKADKD